MFTKEDRQDIEYIRKKPESFAFHVITGDPKSKLTEVLQRLAALDPEPFVLRNTDRGPVRGTYEAVYELEEFLDRENTIDYLPRLPRFWALDRKQPVR